MSNNNLSVNDADKAIRKVCVVLVDRANYGRLKPVMRSIQEHPDLQLQVLAAGTMMLERFDMPVNGVRKDGFPIDGEIYIELEGSNPATMAKSVGFGLIEFASEFSRLKPDLVLLIGDRYEALSAAIAAAYMNLCLVHVQGGEISGSIDESARHAITKFAQFHFPSTKRSAEYIVRMGEKPESILAVGCPSSDIARELDRTLDPKIINGRGGGAEIDTTQPFQLVIFHPTTTEFGGEQQQIEELLNALNELQNPTVLLWPNIDAGSNHVSKAIRKFRDKYKPDWLRTLINLSPEEYLTVLANASCAIGNSSSFVRDASYFGTPVVLVGARQEGRETDEHVVRVPPLADAIVSAAKCRLAHGRFEPSVLYGEGDVSDRIADALAVLEPYTQKRLNYIYASDPMFAATITDDLETVAD
ncbi:UDP-N-acetylglucosamine 2-epimerase [Novipirellula sp. SH528]|uniref:UDP-N-acetylglucosamine 2-epimerase n=1 Tax=Novipirellula sp. SH528 TaxID=3454466 RepID=UPI003FA05B44